MIFIVIMSLNNIITEKTTYVNNKNFMKVKNFFVEIKLIFYIKNKKIEKMN